MNAEYIFDSDSGALSRGDLSIILKPRHRGLLAALRRAKGEFVGTATLAAISNLCSYQVGPELNQLKLRLVKFAIEIEAKRLKGYRLVVRDLPHDGAKVQRSERMLWSEAEIARAIALYEDDVEIEEIARLLGRSYTSTVSKIRYQTEHKGRGGGDVPSFTKISEKQEAERLARRDGYDARDFTAAFFGDPPRGFSALDKMRG